MITVMSVSEPGGWGGGGYLEINFYETLKQRCEELKQKQVFLAAIFVTFFDFLMNISYK